MATVQYKRTTAVSILQIGISRNTKRVNKDDFWRDSHILLFINSNNYDTRHLG